MGAQSSLKQPKEFSPLLVSSRDYFNEMVADGLAKKKLSPPEPARIYLVNMLEFYLETRNLFDAEVSESGEKVPQTLAEMFLLAREAPPTEQFELLKKLADRSLYISGFFGDSLNRKLVDIEYYAGMGGAAYQQLAVASHQEENASVFRLFAARFLDFVDVLTYISQKAMVHNNSNLINLFERYTKTGSEIAKARLIELGVIPIGADLAKKSRQD